MTLSATHLSPELQQWRLRLEKDPRNPLNVDELFTRLPSGLQFAPVYDAGSLGSEHAYLQEFHREWKSQKSPWKSRLVVSSIGAASLSSDQTEAAEKLGFTAWSGKVRPEGHRLPVIDELSEDPITESLCLGRFSPQLNALLKGSNPDKIRIQSVYFHRAGAGETEDIAYCLYLASQYRRMLREQLFDSMLPSLTLHLGTGTRFFLEIARLRALRLLWMNFTSQIGAGRQAGNIQSETSLISWSKTDTDGNLLRHTSAALSAVMGGADSLLIHPHTLDSAHSADAIRLAVNCGHLALEEAKLQDAFDPGAGSYLIEILTHELARQAWALFCNWQEIPLEEMLRSGFFPNLSANGADRQKQEFSQGNRMLIGVNRHPSPLARHSPSYPIENPENPDFPPLKPFFLDA